MVYIELSRADSPNYKAAQHPGGRDEEKKSTTDFINEEALANSDDGVANLEDSVDGELSGRICNAHGVKDKV